MQQVLRVKSADEMAVADYARARQQAFWRSLRARLLGQDNHLRAFAEVKQRFGLHASREIGLHVVPIAQIVGSVGRAEDFDRAFLPSQQHTAIRWQSIARARYEDKPLPPVLLYKVRGEYYVKDGHHRISVAHLHGQEFIEAQVIEMDAEDSTASCSWQTPSPSCSYRMQYST